MITRSLLLASAAILATGTARAADAIIIEPEPVEYVRVCDAYGAGYFYIPGTETCLRIGGEVDFELGFSSDDDGVAGYYGYSDDGYNAYLEMDVYFDARSETEWGTLQSYINFVASGTNIAPTNDPNVAIDDAYLGLGGFRAGYTNTAYTGPYNFRSEFFAHTDGEMLVGDANFMLIQYSYTGGPFGAAISLEDDASGNYAPNIVGALEYAANWGTVYAAAAYATDSQVDGDGTLYDAGFSAKVGLSYAINERSSIRAAVLYASSDNIYAPGSGGGFDNGQAAAGFGGAEWSIMASYGIAATDTLAFGIAGQYFFDFYQNATDNSLGVDGYQIEGNVAWTPVENFTVLTGVAYRDLTDDVSLVGGGSDNLDGSLEGFVRFTREF